MQTSIYRPEGRGNLTGCVPGELAEERGGGRGGGLLLLVGVGGVSWLPQTVLSKFCVAQSRRRRLPAPPPPSSGGEPLRTLRLTGSPPTSRGAANSVFSGPANYSWAHGPSYSVMLTEKNMAWTPTKPTHRWPPVGPVSDDDVLSSHSCLMMIATKMLA